MCVPNQFVQLFESMQSFRYFFRLWFKMNFPETRYFPERKNEWYFRCWLFALQTVLIVYWLRGKESLIDDDDSEVAVQSRTQLASSGTNDDDFDSIEVVSTSGENSSIYNTRFVANKHRLPSSAQLLDILSSRLSQQQCPHGCLAKHNSINLCTNRGEHNCS